MMHRAAFSKLVAQDNSYFLMHCAKIAQITTYHRLTGRLAIKPSAPQSRELWQTGRARIVDRIWYPVQTQRVAFCRGAYLSKRYCQQVSVRIAASIRWRQRIRWAAPPENVSPDRKWLKMEAARIVEITRLHRPILKVAFKQLAITDKDLRKIQTASTVAIIR